MTWLQAPEGVACVHVVCGGYGCQFVPPALGPTLPDSIIDSAGDYWSTAAGGTGRVWYSHAGGRVRLVTQGELLARAAGRPWRSSGAFPGGLWRDALAAAEGVTS